MEWLKDFTLIPIITADELEGLNRAECPRPGR